MSGKNKADHYENQEDCVSEHSFAIERICTNLIPSLVALHDHSLSHHAPGGEYEGGELIGIYYTLLHKLQEGLVSLYC